MDSRVKPALVRLFESIAAVMELDDGTETLELEFRDGNLTCWWRHDWSNKPAELPRYDGRAAWLGARPEAD